MSIFSKTNQSSFGYSFKQLKKIDFFIQLNGNDCGVFLIVFLDFITRLTIKQEEIIFTNFDPQQIAKLFFQFYCDKDDNKIQQNKINNWRRNIKNNITNQKFVELNSNQ
ncbi:hypothetical protein ACTA71_009201 [Dictyostelium dimigraforme]